MKKNWSEQRAERGGFALPVAMFAMVLIGVLVTGGFYMAQQETRIGVASNNAQSAFYLAEHGIYSTLANWDPQTFGTVAAWSSTTVTGTGTDGTYSVDVMPMTQRLFFLRSTGTVTSGGALWSGATRDVGMIARVVSPNMQPPAALSTQGDLRIGGASQIDGGDTNPGAWAGLCTNPLNDQPGVLIDDSTNVDYQGNSYSVQGNPAVAEDATITAASLLDFGELQWADLVALAEKRYNTTSTITNTAADSVLSGGSYVCNSSLRSNWGDPLNPGAVCGNYFPIIYAAQTLRINSNGYGQGILLIEGDLEVQGGFTFYGPVFVKGELRTAGTGGHFNGGVLAANVDLSTSAVLGNAVVTFSSCAVERAILNNTALTKARPLARRSWVDLSSISY